MERKLQPIGQEVKKRKTIILICVTFAVFLIFAVVLIFRNFELNLLLKHLLFNINIPIFLLLITLIIRNLIKLLSVTRKTFRAKLLISFIAIAAIPSLFLFLFASNLITNSINSWFNPDTEAFVNSGYKVASYYIDSTKKLDKHYANYIASQILGKKMLVNGDLKKMEELMNELLSLFKLDIIQVYSNKGIELARATSSPFLKDVQIDKKITSGLSGSGEDVFNIQELPENGYLLCYGHPFGNNGDKNFQGVVTVGKLMERSIVEKIQFLTRIDEEFSQLQIARVPFKRMYFYSFLLFFILLIFGAIWFASYLAKGIAIPVQKLAEGTQAIARGDLDFKIDLNSTDEIGVLIASFNKMTEELKQNRLTIEAANNELKQHHKEIEQAKSYIETVLQNISTGIISLDNQGLLTTFNKTARKILKIDDPNPINRAYFEILQSSQFERLNNIIKSTLKTGTAIHSREFNLRIEGALIKLALTVMPLTDSRNERLGVLVVFEDITELVKAQRAIAWQEVAKRIAHEIKNPLTPIILSTQRLIKKFKEGSSDLPAVVDQATAIILEEAEQLQNLINEFSRFARMPQPKPRPSDLHEIIKNMVSIYREIAPQIQFKTELSPSIPIFNFDPEQMKSVFRNLIDNAIAAMNNSGEITIRTELEPLYQIVKISVLDTGPGIPPEDMDKLFLPYFSTKGEKGTGLGLAIVDKIITDHGGYIKVKNLFPKGTCFTIEIPVKEPVMV